MTSKSKKMGTIHKSQPRFQSRPPVLIKPSSGPARFTQIMFSDAIAQAVEVFAARVRTSIETLRCV